jgi:hypothetical protein
MIRVCVWEGGSPFPPQTISLVLKEIAMRNTAGAETRPPGCDSWLC